jgi:hypothetical protein
MNHKKSFEINEKLFDKIISVAYGDANFKDKLTVFMLAKKNEAVHTLLASYKESAAEVHRIKEEKCPENLLRSVHAKTNVNVKTNKSFINDFYNVVFARPVVSAVLSLILIAAIILSILNSNTVPPPRQYNQTEIQIAEKQTKHALAIVDRIFNETSTTLKDEVIKSRVAKPIRESMGIVNDLFIKGEIQ